jgi:hypothetical protein
MKCQAPGFGGRKCGRTAIWRVDPALWFGFGAKKDARVCDDWSCRSWASNGSAVGFKRIVK